MDASSPMTTNKLLQKLAASLLLLAAFPAQGFYEWQQDNFSLELNGLFRGFGLALENPDSPSFYSRKTLTAGGALARLMLNLHTESPFSAEAHLVQSYIPLSLQTGGSRAATLQGAMRSSVFSWRYGDDRALLEFDRLNLQYATDDFTLKIGRQPINLAATFFFTPNDFFSPFAAQTFYRAYKPGVDAARLDILTGELSQISLIAVLGYEVDASKDNGWRKRPDFGHSSFLGRVSTVIHDFEWAIIGGKVKNRSLVGIDFQGELFEWLGIRAEGHYAFPDDSRKNPYLEFSIGFEHRFENTLSLRVEQFYHGSGADSVDEYLGNLTDSTESPYLARLYTAFGASYEITPLLTGQATFLYNGTDSSSLLALYANYSLSDESELALSINLPFGEKPEGTNIKDEFGLYPRSINLEYRLYF